MKRMISFLLAMVLCMSLATAASAETFTPSAENKGAPDYVPIVDVNTGRLVAGLLVGDNIPEGVERVYSECLILTAVKDLEESDASDEAKALLKRVYEGLKSGEIEYPFEMLDSENADHLVIRDLFDISLVCTCEDEIHAKELEKEGISLQITFDIGLAPGAKVYVTVYKDGRWQQIEVINNGDGTITCFFEFLGPVAIVVETSDGQGNSTGTNTGSSGSLWNPKTGDPFDQSMMLWSGVMLVSACALVLLVLAARKKRK